MYNGYNEVQLYNNGFNFTSYGELTLNENTKVIKEVEVDLESKSFLDLFNDFITDL